MTETVCEKQRDLQMISSLYCIVSDLNVDKQKFSLQILKTTYLNVSLRPFKFFFQQNNDFYSFKVVLSGDTRINEA